MSDWELRAGDVVYGIGAAGFVVGRGAGCDLRLLEPDVSRRHAVLRLSSEGLRVEDLGSRHGVRVNGTLIWASVLLGHGDRITISEHTLVAIDKARALRDRRPTVQARAARGPQPCAGEASAPTGDLDLPGVFVAETEAALERGELQLVQHGVRGLLEIVGTIERAGGSAAILLRRFSTLALRAAVITGTPSWIDDVVSLHVLRSRVMHATTIDALSEALERFPAHSTQALRAYHAAIDAERTHVGAQDLACLTRLAALSAAPR